MENLVPHHIHYTAYEPDRRPIKAAILLLHGMQEHSGRYNDFASYLKGQGYAVLTYDHVGHGRTAKTKAQLGFFRRKKPDQLLVSEAERMSGFIIKRFPDIPLIVMGHSMGSFVARLLLKEAAHRFDGAILMGTGGPNPLATMFLPVLYLANLVAPTKRSRWLNKLFLTINNQKFKHEKPNDGTNWLSADLANRKAFLDDELCGVDFSNNAFFGLISLTVKATRPSGAEGIPRRMPFLFVSGSDDPIGDFGKGVEKTVKGLRDSGFEYVDMKCYPGMRHEILNEHDRQLVFHDIVEWLEKTTLTATGWADGKQDPQ
ncbi:alpha/beta fold hydrolase [Parapedobacter koreensis]|uniref:Lysophospholipase, alpha-beta hydrolase superfamily n=1 Tax=Parapedobacter koreensis TaxID=332977 RepID=A0A1H7UIU4_9SPHI|nr:alpha/beta fold hydrolase [Parapedobacter koreensis]SEL96207.1 Lysophospholipase, alpha-beta hydrolase superfamily [Parapedobacter koreensis]